MSSPGPPWVRTLAYAGVGLLAAFGLSLIPLIPVLMDPDQVLRFNDSSLAYALSPFAQLRTSLVRFWDTQSFFGIGFRQSSANLFTVTDAWLGPVPFRRWGPSLLLAGSAGAVYWMVRGFGWRRRACIFAAGVFLFSGAAYTYAVCGLAVRPLAMAWNALAIGFIERARQTRTWLPYVVAGAFVGCGIAEVPDVGAFLALTTAAVLAVTHGTERPLGPALRRTLAALALVTITALPAAWQMLGIMAHTHMRDVAPAASDPEAQYEWATQWSIPPAETWAVAAGSFFGSTSDSEPAPYWGRMGRTPGWEETRAGFKNFALTGWHIGAIPVLVLLLLFWGAAFPGLEKWDRRIRWGALGIGAGLGITLVLAWGRYTPLYRAVFALPFMGTVRNPEKWMIPFALISVIGIALGLDRMLAAAEAGGEARRRMFSRAARAAWLLFGVSALVGIGLFASRTHFLTQRQAEGWGTAAAVMVRHALTVSFRTAAVLAAAGALFSLPVLRARSAAWLYGLGVLAAVHLLPTAADYVHSYSIRPNAEPNALTEVLDTRRADGRLRLLPPGDSPEMGVLLNQFRLSFLMARGYEMFDPISVSRIPADYDALFNALRDHPFRLWELGAIRFLITGSGMAERLNAGDGNRGRFSESAQFGLDVVDGRAVPAPARSGEPSPVRLVEFEGALPFLHPVCRIRRVPEGREGDAEALRRLASPEFRPSEEAVVHGALDDALFVDRLPETRPRMTNLQMAPVSWEAELAPEAEAGFWVRSVRYDPDWRAKADGVPIPIYRVNHLFQGVYTPPGTRRLTFEYRPSQAPLVLSVSTRLLAAALGIGWLAVRRRAGRVGAPAADPADGAKG